MTSICALLDFILKLRSPLAYLIALTRCHQIIEVGRIFVKEYADVGSHYCLVLIKVTTLFVRYDLEAMSLINILQLADPATSACSQSWTVEEWRDRGRTLYRRWPSSGGEQLRARILGLRSSSLWQLAMECLIHPIAGDRRVLPAIELAYSSTTESNALLSSWMQWFSIDEGSLFAMAADSSRTWTTSYLPQIDSGGFDLASNLCKATFLGRKVGCGNWASDMS